MGGSAGGTDISAEEIEARVEFQEQYFESEVIAVL